MASFWDRLKAKASETGAVVGDFLAQSGRDAKVGLTRLGASTSSAFNKLVSDTRTAMSMEAQIANALRTLRSVTDEKNELGAVNDVCIPPRVLFRAKGLAFVTTVKAGFGMTMSGGLGIVMVRNKDRTWSAPSAIGCGGIGFGLQAGGSMTRSVIVLNTDGAVEAFSGETQIKLGSSVSVAAGPVGREASGDIRANVQDGSGKGAQENQGGAAAPGSGDAKEKLSACFSYSFSKGLFAGVALEGAVLRARADENKRFYGETVTPRQIFSGGVVVPTVAPSADVNSVGDSKGATDPRAKASAPRPALKVGDSAVYRGEHKVTVVAVHTDDPSSTYYTVKMDNGKEVQALETSLEGDRVDETRPKACLRKLHALLGEIDGEVANASKLSDGIIRALYGAFDVINQRDRSIDVTDTVKQFVQSGYLVFPAGTRCSSMFRVDPWKGKRKVLHISFRVNGRKLVRQLPDTMTTQARIFVGGNRVLQSGIRVVE